MISRNLTRAPPYACSSAARPSATEGGFLLQLADERPSVAVEEGINVHRLAAHLHLHDQLTAPSPRHPLALLLVLSLHALASLRACYHLVNSHVASAPETAARMSQTNCAPLSVSV